MVRFRLGKSHHYPATPSPDHPRSGSSVEEQEQFGRDITRSGEGTVDCLDTVDIIGSKKSPLGAAGHGGLHNRGRVRVAQAKIVAKLLQHHCSYIELANWSHCSRAPGMVGIKDAIAFKNIAGWNVAFHNASGQGKKLRRILLLTAIYNAVPHEPLAHP
jgi:hypothetical protein